MDNYLDFISRMDGKALNLILKERRLYFDVDNKNILEIADHLFNIMGCRLSTATAQENYSNIEVLYHFSHDLTGNYYCPRVLMNDKEHPRMKSISPIVKGAEWIEREMTEMLGIVFEGHPDPEPLLTGNNPKNLKTPLRHRRNNG
jgi:NADH-quinone oxidoreductase subunit C